MTASVKGNDGAPNISLKDLISINDIDQVISNEIDIRLTDVAHASPAQYAIYFEKVAGFGLGPYLDTYIELKATRDILVHNDGVINAVYTRKAGNNSRGSEKTKIVIDAEYFEGSIRTLKNITSAIYRGLLKKYGESQSFANAAIGVLDI